MPGTVTVASKLRNGLILRGFRFETRTEQVMGGGTRDVKVAVDTGKRMTINGNAAPFGQALIDGEGNAITVTGGFALTHNVDADLWETWLEQNKDTDMVRNGLVFAHAKPLEVRAQARENAKQRTGMEPMDPTNDPRMSRRDRTGQKLRGGAINGLEPALPGA